MRPTLAALILALAASTALAQPQPAAPVVNPPNPQTNVVISLADYLTPGVSVYEAFKRALLACRQQKAAKLVVPTGRYVFDDPAIMQHGGQVHIGLFGLSDLTIDGQGSEFIFHFPQAAFHIDDSHRILLRNFTIDYALNLASPAVVAKEADGTTSVRIIDAYPADASTPFVSVKPYDITNLRFRKSPGAVFDPRDVRMIRPQTFVSPDFNSLAAGEEVLVRHFRPVGNAFSIPNYRGSDISIEGVTIYGAPGMGFYIAGQRGFRISNSRIMRKPGTQRPISTAADAAHFTATSGDILIEDCDFSGHGDDALNITGLYVPVTEKVNSRTLILTRQYNEWLIPQGAEVKFVKPNTLAEYARAKVMAAAYDPASGRFTVTVDRDLPEGLTPGDLAISVTQNNSRFLVRRNFFHDFHGRGMLIQSPEGVIENNRVKDSTSGALYVTTDNRFFREGYGAENLVMRNNSFEGSNYAGEIGQGGPHMAAVSILAGVPAAGGYISSSPVHRNLLIEGNTIIDTPGLAILIASSDGVTVRNNTIVRSNQIPFSTFRTGEGIDAQARGSIMVTRASNVTVTGNRQVVTPGMFDRGVYVDARNTSNITVQGNVEEAPPNSVQFGGSTLQVSEAAGRATVAVTRSGDTAAAATVDYRTEDSDAFTVGCADAAGAQGSAYARCDFATAVGTVSFAPGETSKQVTVPVIDDGHAEGAETFRLRLSNAAGASLGDLSAATVTITDNDAAGAANPVVSSVPFFVRQQYLDFLSREPDEGGFNAWSGVLNNCPNIFTGPQAQSGCDRIFVSGDGFFRSVEFQLKGAYVFRFYKVAFNRLPEYAEVVSDMSFVAGATAAEVFARRAELAVRFAQRQEFQTLYAGMTNEQYVAALLGRYQLTQITTPDPASPDAAGKVVLTQADLVARLGSGALTRAQVLRAVADSDQVSQREFDNAFVAMQYYGYLRRKPEAAGYEAWLRVLRSGDTRTMVDGFLNSAEYKLRFGQP